MKYVVCVWCIMVCMLCFFFFKQKTAYEMRISDWSSDVCSSDLGRHRRACRRAITFEAALGHVQQERLGGRDATLDAILADRHDLPEYEIGRASCRERVCQYV